MLALKLVFCGFGVLVSPFGHPAQVQLAAACEPVCPRLDPLMFKHISLVHR